MNGLELYSKISDILSANFKNKDNETLVEEGKKATCREVRLEKSGNIAIYKFDNLPNGIEELLPFFKNTGDGHKQLCDYLIFYPVSEKLIVFICNLKSKQLGTTHRQVKNGYVFGKYIVEMASICLNMNELPSFVEFKALHFTSHHSATKIPTNPRSIKFKTYSNQLKYMVLPCNRPCSLDLLERIE